MGGKKYRLEEVLPLLEEKDAKIARLELEVQAFAARASHMQGRFLSTLDALDELEAKHRLELDESQQEIHQLRTNLSRYIARVEAAESERDDMRDAVMQLVEKVEKSNDYSLWPHSRIRLARPAGKNASASIRTREDLPSDEDLHAYASALIASLRVERDLERKAHAITRRDAEHRVALLEAQVARRDAELEACIFHPEHMSKLQAAEHEPKLVPLSAKDTSLSEEDIISVLEMTARRNRALELEVKEIAARLENARASCSSDGGETPTKLPGHSSPAQPEHLTSLNTPRASARRPCAARESNGLAALSSEDETIRVPDERRANAFAYARPSSDSEADMVPHWLHALHEQVAALGRQVQAFGEERDALARLVSGTKHPDTPNEPPAVNDPAHGGMGRIASPEHGPPVPPIAPTNTPERVMIGTFSAAPMASATRPQLPHCTDPGNVRLPCRPY
ncbi:hypothetical protein GLOTRDRAFT_121105 [Gloeophyllum trabeum ATCC 11539]|uniref:Uncharacterized protein n=1 Tax=Gloeophyllum trabeum (strain ATCC 11539 / FP-39264 / Madison 617) TaxID=670483 RepID=S7QBN6_GLOTA|nr:uncharacterized protein GLOTRDRAFT_121105 [Gloeophyllum trabeum ATCC 11539]EPQ56773.1 hypothetical protein GLOTRDRAFT_121105 [Gloeophyllum trabeum ATCC 11539]